MGLFDRLGGALSGGGAFAGLMEGALMRQLPAKLTAALAATPFGSVEGALERFREAGFAAEVESWLSPGDNLPLTREQVMEAIDPVTMGDLAESLNLPAAMLPGLIAQYLPLAVDRLSPDGIVKLPE